MAEKNEKKPLELNGDALEQVAGGGNGGPSIPPNLWTMGSYCCFRCNETKWGLFARVNVYNEVKHVCSDCAPDYFGTGGGVSYNFF